MIPRRPRRGAVRSALAALALAALMLAAPIGLTSVTAAAGDLVAGTPAPVSATVPASTGASTVAPMFADTLQFSLTSITPEVVTDRTGNTLAVRGTVTNSLDTPVTDLIYRVQRGRPLTTRGAVEQQLVDPAEPTAAVSAWHRFGSDLPGGATDDFGLATAINGKHDNSLQIPRPGIYPVMINVNGTRDVDGVPTEVRVGQLHLLVTVTSLAAAPDQPSVLNSRVPTGWIWKLSSAPHRGVGGVFLDESLAAEIAPGGRLAERLEAVRSAGMPAGTLTLAVDPLLLDELTAMSRGYWVQNPGTAQGPVTSAPATPTSAPIDPSADGSAADDPDDDGATGRDDSASPGTGSSDDPETPSGSNGAVPTDDAPDGSDSPATANTSGTSASSDNPDTASPTVSGDQSTSGAGQQTTEPAPTDNSANDNSANGSPTTSSPTTGSATTGDTSAGITITAEAPASTATTDEPTTTPVAPEPVPPPQPPDTVAGSGQAHAVAFLDGLREAARTAPILVLPYSDPDSVALTRADEKGTLAGLSDIGRRVAQDVFTGELVEPLITDVALPPNAIADPETVRAYAEIGFRSVVLDGSGVVNTDEHSGDGLGKVITDQAAGSALPALLDDSPVQDLIDTVLVPTPETTSAVALNGAVALLVRRSIDGDARPLLRLPDALIDTGGLADLAAALRLLAADKVIDPASPADLTAMATSDAIPIDPTTGDKSGAPGTLRTVIPEIDDLTAATMLNRRYLDRLAGQRADLATLHHALDLDTVAAQNGIENTVGSGDDALALLDTLTNALTPMTSVTLRSTGGHRTVADAVLSTIDTSVQYLRSGVALASSVGSYTLAGTDSPLLLTVQNTLPFPVMVTVRIDGGDSVGLQTEQPDLVAVPAQSSRQVSIPTTVNRAGSFTVSAQIVGPDGQDWNVPQTLRIRSNAYGTVTIILIVVAGGVLLLMVVLRIWQRWKERQRRLAAEANPQPDTSADGADGTDDRSTDDRSADDPSTDDDESDRREGS